MGLFIFVPNSGIHQHPVLVLQVEDDRRKTHCVSLSPARGQARNLLAGSSAGPEKALLAAGFTARQRSGGSNARKGVVGWSVNRIATPPTGAPRTAPIDAIPRAPTLPGMTLTSYPELMKLPDRQKLALADALWQAGISDATPIAAKQKKLLDTRWAVYRAGKTKRITLEELDRRLAKS